MFKDRFIHKRWIAPLLLAAIVLATFAARGLQVNLADADKLYAEKSYGEALKVYEALQKQNAVPATRKDDVALRIATSLGKTQQWDRSLAESLDFVKTHRGTVWEPRGLYWLGRLYLGAPRQGYRIGQRIYRGNDVPKQPDSDAAPERVDLGAQDAQNAHDALEAARVLFGAYRDKEDTRADEIQLDFDLARDLTQSPDLYLWAQKLAWDKPDAAIWRIDTSQNYDPKWPAPKRLMYLYAQIPGLAEPLSDGPHQSALALFGKALWLKLYHTMMNSYALRYEKAQQVRIPYPYQDMMPEAVMEELVQRYPDDSLRDQAQYTAALWYQQANKFPQAVAELRRLITDRPGSKWTVDARRDLEQITRQQLSISVNGFHMSGTQPTIQVGYRNLKDVQFRVFRVKLEDGISNARVQNNPNRNLNQYDELYSNLSNLEGRFGQPIAHWALDTKDKGDYQYGNETITVPVSDTGAYVVEARGASVRAGTVLLVTDLSLVQKTHRDGALLFVADARSGAPVPRAHVVAKQFWYEGNSQHSAFSEGDSNAEGILTVALLRAPGRSSFRIQAVAMTGQRYAMTDNLYTYDNNDNPNLIQVYSVTDRSVYRPTQRVYYRQLVMEHDGGNLKPVADATVHVVINDPQGKIIYESDSTSSEFGTVKGEFDLSHNVLLGEYQISVTVPKLERGYTQLGGNRFRVEEYKKPEFEVSVTTTADRIKLGETTTATVHASYYFGGPVPNAHVSYRVYRNYWAQQYRFPRAFDFLYGYSDNGDYSNYYRNGTVVAQGESATDANGDAKVPISTKSQAGDGGDGQADLNFTVEADVQDASRRVISGSGSVKATRHDVAVFLDFPHGYASKGDRVDVEIVTLNPSDKPVSVSGFARVYRQPATPDFKETKIYEEPLKTDKQGRAFFHWKDAPSGYFRVAFETRDTAEQGVSGSTHIWVDGPELASGKFQFQNVSLMVENPYYEQDQTARVLLITPVPNSTVLLIREANNEILGKEVLHVPGRSLELKVPLTRRDVPNVFLTAITIRNGQPYQATQELFVPPARQFATIGVEADKPQYQPGEKAHLRLSALDWQGKPLRTELSLAVTDASLNYIQKDYAPDLRSYYYGNRRSISNQTGHSLNAMITLRDEDDQPVGQYATHEWLLPEGMGRLMEWPGAERQSWYYLNGYSVYSYFRGMHGSFGGSGFGARADFGRAGEIGDKFAALEPLSVRDEESKRPLESEMAANGPGGAPAGRPAGAKPSSAVDKRESGKDRIGDALQNPSLRTHFADTAFWTPAVVTDAQGHATVDVVWPDNLTQWRAAAVGVTRMAQVGVGETRIRTKKDLIVRLQAPRFFVERDSLLLTANVQNYLPKAARIKVRLDLGDNTAEIVRPAQDPTKGKNPLAVAADGPEVWVEVPRDGEARVDWNVHVRREGSLQVKMTAQSHYASDATEMTFPVLVHGVERATVQNGVLRDRSEAKLTISLPKARKPGSSELVVNLNPSLATIMLDALPYLNGYPYGCVEQTMSRFMPSVMVAQTLKESGYNLEDLGKRAKLLDERAIGVKPRQKIANSAYTYPNGRPGVLQTAHLAHTGFNPVFDSAQLKSMLLDGLARIQQLQHGDGGWGWWPQDSSDPFMTAYVLYGLQVGKKAGYAIDQGMLDRGMRFLEARFREDDSFHRMAYEARTLAMDERYRASIRPLVTGRLFTNREQLSAYSKALLALALHDVGDREKAAVVLRNLQTTVRLDKENGTASWGQSDRFWWHWYNDRVETNAVVLQAYLAIDPSSPMPAMLVKWLANNRRANSWSDTRQTATAIYALCDYAHTTKELDADYTLTVDLGGRVRRVYTVNHDNALLFDNEFVVPDELLRTGDQTLTITKRGKGACYYGTYTRYFSLEEPIAATGNEISVSRRYFRLKPNTASGTPVYRPIKLERENPFLTGHYELLYAGGEYTIAQQSEDGPHYERTALKDGEKITSGDMVEVELQLESKNDYEYLAFEDMKPAGCEPVALRSGGRMGLGVYSNMELRDQKVAFFISHMPQGTRTLTYRLRAEIPGEFHVLPTNGYAMYAPDIRCLSRELLLGIKDAPPGRQPLKRTASVRSNSSTPH